MKSMKQITALVHACDCERTIGRALESLRVCNEVVVVDGGSRDQTAHFARQFGARLIVANPADADPSRAFDCAHDWIFWLRPEEAAAESLEAGILEWRLSEDDGAPAYRVAVRQEVDGGWKSLAPELRIVHRRRVAWRDGEPLVTGEIPLFHGEILRLK